MKLTTVQRKALRALCEGGAPSIARRTGNVLLQKRLVVLLRGSLGERYAITPAGKRLLAAAS